MVLAALFQIWRLSPVVFPVFYYCAVQSALGVWNAVTIYEPGWSMPPQLAWPVLKMVVWSLASCVAYVVGLNDVEDLPGWIRIPFGLVFMAGLLCAFGITLLAGLLSFPMVFAASNQPSIFIPVFGVFLACPWWITILKPDA